MSHQKIWLVGDTCNNCMPAIIKLKIKQNSGDLPGGLMVKIPSFQYKGSGFSPGSESLRSHMLCGHGQKKNFLIR